LLAVDGEDRVSLVTAVLCGGRGLRAWPLTASLPKPLLPVGDVPVLRHVLEIYAQQGHDEFVLAAGYRAEAMAEFARTLPRTWSVEVVDTGPDTSTGERLRRLRAMLGGTFFATYGDGVSDVDLTALMAAHAAGGRLATLTAVPLRSQYGTLAIGPDGAVQCFQEKPVIDGQWINGGFFVLDRAVFDEWPGPDLERDVLPTLAARGALSVHQHDGFWRSVDTQKDLEELTVLARDEPLPWLRATEGAGERSRAGQSWRGRESA
jgi:glucose-1-phosphate cytidylyltransferase